VKRFLRFSKSNLDVQKLIDTLKFRIESVLRARRSKYILMNVPNDKIEEVGKILPVLQFNRIAITRRLEQYTQ
jgi:ATP phosphoribosyltransferase-like protein